MSNTSETVEFSAKDVKICLLGETGVGKSSLVTRFCRSTFNIFSAPTIGASFMTKVVPNSDGKLYKFHIWDTAGQERFHALMPMYYRGASGIIIVYDITDLNSFQKVQQWVSELKTNGGGSAVLAIAGNKRDLEELREVEFKEADQYAKDVNALFVEVSAKSDHNINELFLQLSDRLPNDPEIKKVTEEIKLEKNLPKNKNCPC